MVDDIREQSMGVKQTCYWYMIFYYVDISLEELTNI